MNNRSGRPFRTTRIPGGKYVWEIWYPKPYAVPFERSPKISRKRYPSGSPHGKRDHDGKPHARFRERPAENKLLSTGFEKYDNDTYHLGPYPYPPTLWSINLEKCWDETHPPPYKSGGPFTNIKFRFPTPVIQGSGEHHGDDFRPYGFLKTYVGGFAPSGFGAANAPSIHDMEVAGPNGSGPFGPGYEDPSGYGPEAYKRMKPKSEYFDLPQFLGDDLKDLPSQLKKTAEGAKDAYKLLGGNMRSAEMLTEKVADQFLNYQFGWAPFLNDVAGLIKTAHDQERYIDWQHKHTNRWLKRGVVLLESSDIENLQVVENFSGLVTPALTSDFYDASVRYNLTPPCRVKSTTYERVYRKIWAEGKFMMFRPSYNLPVRRQYDKNTKKLFDLLRIYGINVNPKHVWELTPWTWLADWFGNIGDVIDNIGSFYTDGLVSQYAYIMQHTKRMLVNESEIRLRDGNTQSCYWYWDIESKIRRNCDGFHFGLNPGESLNLRRIAILGALGIKFSSSSD
jgi:hypothetical protein